MYRRLVESLLGLRLEVDRLRVEPKIPASWPGFEVTYRHRGAVYNIRVTSRGGGPVWRVVCDGVEQATTTIPLRDDGKEHQVEGELGG